VLPTASDQPSNARGEQSAHQRHTEGHRRGAPEGGQSGQRRVCLAEGQAPPGETAERSGVPQSFLGHPGQRHHNWPHPANDDGPHPANDDGPHPADDDGPHPADPCERRSALEQGAGQTEQRDVAGLQHGQGDPWERADVDTGPGQQRQETGQPADQTEQGALPGGGPERRQGQDRDTDRRQGPEVV